MQAHAAGSYTTHTTPHYLCDVGYAHNACRRTGAKLQVKNFRIDEDMMKMRHGIVMMHEHDVFVDVGWSDVAEQGKYDANMLHDMTTTQHITHASGVYAVGGQLLKL